MQHRLSKFHALAIAGVLSAASLAITPAALAAGWVSESSPTTSHLSSIDCVSGNHCVAVGSNGTIIQRNGATDTWSTQTSGVTTSLYHVDMYSSSLAVAVGASGVILRTTDGGTTWTAATSGTTETLYGIKMQTNTIGWAVGDNSTILKTINGGVNWTNLGSSISIDARSVDAVSSSALWVAGKGGRVIKSSTGGSSWTDVSPSPSVGPVNSIQLRNTNIAYISGSYGLLMKTTDGGTSWSNMTATGFGSLESVFADYSATNVGTIVGSDGSVASTTDGSTYVEELTSPAASGLSSVAALATTRRFAVGENGSVYAYDNEGPLEVPDFAMTDGDATNDTTPSFSWSAGEDEMTDVVSYELSPDESAWENVGDVTSYELTDVLAEGTYTYYLRAVDEFDNADNTVDVTFTVDTTQPTVSAASPTTALTSTSTQFTVTASDSVSGIVSCDLYVNSTRIGAMTEDAVSGDWTANHTFTAAGTYSSYAVCEDGAGNTKTGSTTSVTVTGSTSSDTTAPSVGGVTPTTAVSGTATTFSASYADAGTVSSCTLYVNGSSVGLMTLSSGTASVSYTFTSTGTKTAYVTCTDSAGNVGTGTTTTITVSTTSTDTTAPSVGAITPTTATAGTTTTLRAAVTDSGGMGTCALYVNSTYVDTMTIVGSYATRSYTFSSAGTSTAYAYCTDAAGNSTRGATTTITISAAEVAASASYGDLIKTACPGNEDVNHPCRAVYYYGEDGKRHAFPNERVFFTWYNNFDDVVTVTGDYMASLTLGRNVTYHPGTKMVKFLTDNTVFAVGQEGELRAINSETTAIALYGSTWNQQIDDISDAFFGNYRFGDDITSTLDYDADEVEALVDSIDDVL